MKHLSSLVGAAAVLAFCKPVRRWRHLQQLSNGSSDKSCAEKCSTDKNCGDKCHSEQAPAAATAATDKATGDMTTGAETATDADTTGIDGTWLTSLEAGMAKAKESGKPILVDFTGSDWCGWCIKLDKEVFDHKAFKAWAIDRVVLVKLDFPRRKAQTDEERAANEAAAQKYGIRGFPTVLLLDAEGNVLQQTGYQQGGVDAWTQHIKA